MDAATEEDPGGGVEPRGLGTRAQAQGNHGGTLASVSAVKRPQTLDKLVLHAQRTSLCPATFLEQIRQARPVVEGGVSFALFSSRPGENSLRVPWMHYVGLFISVPTLLLSIYNSVASLNAGQIQSFRHYRFTSLEQRDVPTGPLSPGIASFGLLNRGEAGLSGGVSRQGRQGMCKDAQAGTFKVDGASMTLSLDSAEAPNHFMWYITTLQEPGSQGLDAVRFVLEGSDDEAEWTQVGSSTSVFLLDAVVLTDGRVEVPEARGSTLLLDATMDPWHWMTFSLCHVLINLWTFCNLVLAATGRAGPGYRGFVLNIWSQSVARGCLGIVMLADGSRNLAVSGTYALSLAAIYAFGAFVLRFYEQLLDIGIIIFAGSQVLLEPIFHAMLFADAPNPTPTLYWALPRNLSFMFVGLNVLFIRIIVLVMVHTGVTPGKMVYAAVWERVMQGQEADVVKLRKTVRRAIWACRGAKKRQLNYARHSEARNIVRLPKEKFSDPYMDGSPFEGEKPYYPDASPSREGSDAPLVSGPTSADSGVPSEQPQEPPPAFSSGAQRHRNSVPHFLSNAYSSMASLAGSVRSVLGLLDARDRPAARESNFVTNLLQSAWLGAVVMQPSPGRVRESDLGEPVRKLDQIYSQAFLVHDLFLEYTVRLAAGHGGMFRLHQADAAGSLFAPWDGGEAERARFSLGGIKRIARATSKIGLAYYDDASLLNDMVRETLHFDTVADLERCLSAVVEDPAVDVVRVKSTMQPPGEFDAVEAGSVLWAGMPFVKVNLRLAGSAEARALCVDAHVCELLLVLKDVAAVQTDLMAKKFRQWRNCKRIMSALAGWHRLWRRRERAVAPEDPSMQPSEAPSCGNTSGPAEPQRPSDAAPAAWELHSENSENLSKYGGSVRGSIILMDKDAEEVGGFGRGRAGSDAPPPALVFRGGETSWGMRVTAEMEELLVGLSRLSGPTAAVGLARASARLTPRPLAPALGLSDFLDRGWRSVLSGVTGHGLESSPFRGLLYTQHPITNACTRLPVQVFLLAIGSFFVARGALSAHHFSQHQTRNFAFGPYRHYRLATGLTRNGSEGAAVLAPGVSDFGLLGISRCTPEGTLSPAGGDLPAPVPSNSASLGSSFVATYPEGANMTGWFLKTGVGEGSEALDPAYFVVWATNEDFYVGDGSCTRKKHSDEEGGAPPPHPRWWEGQETEKWCGANWMRVGSPFWRYNQFLVDFSGPKTQQGSSWWDFVQIEVALPQARGHLETFSLIPTWNLFGWSSVVPQMIIGFSCLLAGLTPRLPRHLRRMVSPPHVSLPVGILLATVSQLVAAIYYGSAGANHLLAEALGSACSWAVLVATLTMRGSLFLYGCWAFVAVSISVHTALCAWLFRWALVRMQFFITSFAAVFFIVVFTAIRTWHTRKWQRQSRGDQAKYDRAWAALEGHTDFSTDTEHLDKVVKMVGLDKRSPCLQRNRLRCDQLPPGQRDRWLQQQPRIYPRVFPLMWDLGHWYSPGRPDPRSVVSSVSQLYAASAIAHLLLTERVLAWAERSNGMVRLSSGSGDEGRGSPYVLWNDVKEDPTLRGRCLLTRMKRHSRAIEKLLRSYKNHPTFLRDICRQTLVFRSLKDLTMCLGVIITDENVRTERIKNRMSPAHNPDTTGGYRDVLINLKVVNADAQELGAELTVCEIQLVLEEFALLMTPEGHKNYVLGRNGMGI